jgi:ribosome biogenesis GTPase
MELAALGFDDELAGQARTRLRPGQCLARVTAVDRESWLLRSQDGEVRGELAGRLRFALRSAEELPCAGDWVCAQWPVQGGPALIHDVLPRRTFLRRKSAGRSSEAQMIAAHIDVAFIVQGCPHDFNRARLDRYLVMAHEGRVEPRIILSKIDLIAPEELQRLLGQLADSGVTAPVLPVSHVTGGGLEALRAQLLSGRTYGFLGSSGVGKSTLINHLLGRAALATRAVSETGEGVHTTSRRQLLVLEGGALLIDTPGLRELGLSGADDGMTAAFADVGDFAARCRFPDCTHIHEPGCAVIAALERGELGADRYESYLKLRKEAAFQQMSYIEKRRKDRDFGRMAKVILKGKRP